MRANPRDREGETDGSRNVVNREQPSIELGQVSRNGEEAV